MIKYAMKKRGLLVVLILVFCGFVNAIDITNCQSLSSNNIYDLTSNVTANINSHCFTGSGTNITLDCHGHSIIGNQSSTESYKWAFYITGSNLTVRNCVIDLWNLSGWGTTFYEENNSVWDNLSINSKGGQFRFNGGANNTIKNLNLSYGSEIYNSGTTNNLTIERSVLNGRLNIDQGIINIYDSYIKGDLDIDTNLTMVNTTLNNSTFGNSNFK